MASRNLALLVGVGAFGDPAFKTLRFCDNDVDDFAGVLSNPEIAQFEVKALHDPKRDQILEALDRSAAKLQPEDKLIFYYAGHGKRSPTGKLYLVAADTKLEALRATAVPIDQILEIMQESHSSQRVMILDCCHSGAVGGEFRGEIADNLQELARVRGTCILAASTGIQLAEERESVADGKGNGIFTRYLVEGLKTGRAARNADVVTVDSLYDYAFEKVVTSSTQTPMKWVIGGVGNIVIGKSTSGGWQQQKKAIEEEFRSLHASGLIPGAFLDTILQLTKRDWSELDAGERSFGDKLLLFSRKDITLLELLREDAAPPQQVEPSEDRPAAPAAAEPARDEASGSEPNVRISLFDRNIISFGRKSASPGNAQPLIHRIVRSPLGPFILLVVWFGISLLIIESLNRSEQKQFAGITFALEAIVVFIYSSSLLGRQISQIAVSKGLSLRAAFNVLAYAIFIVASILLIIAAINI